MAGPSPENALPAAFKADFTLGSDIDDYQGREIGQVARTHNLQ
jgi:hypothetical protein